MNINEPVTHASDGTCISHDASSFKQRLKIKSADLKASDIDQCLHGQAERWFATELAEATRVGIPTSVDLWCPELEKRFKEIPTVALQKLKSLRYTNSDTRARKGPEEFIQKIITLNNTLQASQLKPAK